MSYQTFPTWSESKEGARNMATSGDGYSVLAAAIFLMAAMIGMGILAIPKALAGTGWYGIALIILSGVDSYYCAVILGRAWIILEENWEEYKGNCRYPFPAIGLRAFGPCMRYTVTVLLHINFIGIGAVYVLLAAQTGQSLTQSWFHLNYYAWIAIVCVILCPLMWFGSIEEFWFAAVAAFVTATVTCCVIFAGILLEIPKTPIPVYENPTLTSFALAFGTIMFSFGGVGFFPSVQVEMKDRRQYTKANLIGFGGVGIFLLILSISGYAVFGSKVTPNILFCFTNKYMKTTAEILLSAHVVMAVLLVLNPPAQEIEDAFHIPRNFNYKRCIIRTSLMGLVMLLAYAVPRFDLVMNLIGGSTFNILSFVLPPLFYVKLLKIPDKRDDALKGNADPLSLYSKIFLLQVMILGIVGGISCTYFAFVEIINVLYWSSHS